MVYYFIFHYNLANCLSLLFFTSDLCVNLVSTGWILSKCPMDHSFLNASPSWAEIGLVLISGCLLKLWNGLFYIRISSGNSVKHMHTEMAHYANHFGIYYFTKYFLSHGIGIFRFRFLYRLSHFHLFHFCQSSCTLTAAYKIPH